MEYSIYRIKNEGMSFRQQVICWWLTATVPVDYNAFVRLQL